MDSLIELTAIEALTRIADGRLTSEIYIEACLERIAELEATVGAWECLQTEQALATARLLDRSPRRGLLHGLPVGVKDIFDTIDMPTRYGSPIYARHQPIWDAASVALIREAGGVIVGKTVTSEFAYFMPGRTTNPHDPTRTPGGSSSGSAAAIAAKMLPLSIGTQTAGSIIRPAAFCGVVGYKPTYGLISLAGVKPFASSLDTVGAFGREVPDVAVLVGALTGRDLRRLIPLGTAPRIGLCRTPQWSIAESDTVAALDEARNRLDHAHCKLTEINLPPHFADLFEAQKCIMAYEAARALAFEKIVHTDKLSTELLQLLDEGYEIPHETYDFAQIAVRVCRSELAGIFDSVDALIAPSSPGVAPIGLASTGDPVFNRMWSVLGVPCVNVPGLVGTSNMPIGIQVVGRPLDDARLLAVADWVCKQLR